MATASRVRKIKGTFEHNVQEAEDPAAAASFLVKNRNFPELSGEERDFNLRAFEALKERLAAKTVKAECNEEDVYIELEEFEGVTVRFQINACCLRSGALIGFYFVKV